MALGWLSLWTYAPPRPLEESAPLDEFSAARAGVTVGAIARQPRTMGSAAHADARRYLVERFEEMGLETTLEEATVLRARGERLLGARVVNVLARLRGSGRPGAVLLMAHYDSVPGSPGAGDDASGVAAIVETVRALTAGPPLERDVLVLLTDGEEAGLLGARAFARDLERLGEIALVLNFEARGSGGPVTMFESSGGNHRLVEEMARVAPWPVASSLSYEVYRRMPNDTDFSVLRRAGATGLNFAMIGRYPSYHTGLDTVERLSARSLQHHGSYAVALARHFGDLEQIPAAAADGVYSNLFGRHGFFAYSSNTARGLTVPLVLLAAAGLTIRSRRHRGRVAGAGWGVLLFAGATVAGPAAAVVIWRGLVLLAPDLRQAPHGIPWIAPWLTLAGVLLTVASIAALVRLLDRLAETVDLWIGVLLAWTFLAVASSFFLAGGSYMFLWPALAGWIALGLVEWRSGWRRWRPAIAAAAALPAVMLLAPVCGQLIEALTVRLAGPSLMLLGWIATLLVVPLAEVARRGRGWIETGLAAAAVGVLATAVWTAGQPGPATPATTELFYVHDADVGRAFWVSADRRLPEWTAGLVDASSEAESVRDLVPGYRPLARRGPAPALEIEPPVASFEPLETGPERLRLRLRSPRGAPVLRARLAGETSFRLIEIDGEPPPPELLAAPADGMGELELTFFAPPADGLDLVLEPGDGRLELRLTDQTYGLPAVDGVPPRRPPGLIAPAGWTTDSTRTIWPERPPEGAPGDGGENEPEGDAGD